MFLHPVPLSQERIYLGVRNPSDYLDIDFRAALAARGYEIVGGPNGAHHLLQANVLDPGKLDKNRVSCRSDFGREKAHQSTRVHHGDRNGSSRNKATEGTSGSSNDNETDRH